MATTETPVSQLNSFGQRVLELMLELVDVLTQAYQSVYVGVGTDASLQFQEVVDTHQAIIAAAAWTPPSVDELISEAEAIDLAQSAAVSEWRAAKEIIVAELGDDLGISFEQRSLIAQELIDKMAARLSLVTEDARSVVARAIAQAWLEGLSVQQTSALIRHQVTDVAARQAEVLARTDLIGLANGASFLAAKAMQKADPEAVIFKQWLATPDDKTRPTHVEANGQVALLDADFTVGGAKMSYPADPIGPDQEVINCRCTLIYVDADPADDLTASADQRLLDQLAERLGLTSATVAWDPTLHPRVERGRREGGRFRGRVGVTAFRPEDDPEGFFESQKFEQFEQDIAEAAAEHGVTIDAQERVQGFWMGEQEPSLAIEAHDGETGVRAFAEEVRADWDQDGVLLFDYDEDGDSLSFRLNGGDPTSYATALSAAGVQGATIHADGVEVIGDDSMIDQVETLRASLGIDPQNVVVKRGKFELVER